jgi:energy-coupling factor transporter transmembrane protein EcfT
LRNCVFCFQLLVFCSARKRLRKKQNERELATSRGRSRARTTFQEPALTHGASAADVTEAGEVDEAEVDDVITIVCPTCRAQTALPPGGVESLQVRNRVAIVDVVVTISSSSIVVVIIVIIIIIIIIIIIVVVVVVIIIIVIIIIVIIVVVIVFVVILFAFTVILFVLSNQTRYFILLQTNFYVEQDDNSSYNNATGKHASRPLPCDLCSVEGEEGARAQFTCSACTYNICPGCRKVHDRICKNKNVIEIDDVTGVDDDVDSRVAALADKLSRSVQVLVHLQSQFALMCRWV